MKGTFKMVPVGRKYIQCDFRWSHFLSIIVPKLCTDVSETCQTVHRITGFLDFFHCLVFYRTRRFGNCICFRPQVKGPNWVGVYSPTFTWGRKQIQFPKHRVFYSLEYQTMEKVQKPSNSVFYTPLSEQFRIYMSDCSSWIHCFSLFNPLRGVKLHLMKVKLINLLHSRWSTVPIWKACDNFEAKIS
jgi:hypothetical protein